MLTMLATACANPISGESTGDLVLCSVGEKHTFSDAELNAMRQHVVDREDRWNRVLERICKK